MPRTIIIGYGNVDRADDGVAFHIVRGLRRALGQPELTEDHEGDEILGQEPDSIFVPQLVPELMDIVSAYERIIFVDAHTGPGDEPIRCERLRPTTDAQLFSHHLTPGTFLAFLEILYHRTPESFLVSVRAEKFDFSALLSPRTAAFIEPACALVLQLLAGHQEETPSTLPGEGSAQEA